MKILNPCIGYIIQDLRADNRPAYVAAPKGYHRTPSGIVRDGTPSPEMTGDRAQAHVFKSHRSAALTAGTLGKYRIHPVT